MTRVPALDCSLSRRQLLRGAAVLGGAAAASTALPVSYAFGATGGADVLVVLSLRGGFDGLSAVVPASSDVGRDRYDALRPSIGVPVSQLLPLDGHFGLHPVLAPLKPLWDNGTLAVVHGVGNTSNGTRSHFEAMREWERAASGSSATTGWLDRALTAAGATSVFSGVASAGSLPQSLAGPAPALAVPDLDGFGLDGIGSDQAAAYAQALGGLHAGLTHPVAQQARTTLAALQQVSVAQQAYTPAGGASYPDTDLGHALRDVARLVKAGLGLRVATVDLGDWDMHDGLGYAGGVDSGRMHERLGVLAAALAAFATDTGLQGVTVVTASEFGRRVQENDSGGVDHGHGNCQLVLGRGVRGGRVYGQWPGLADAALDDGDLAAATDYRAVLADLLTARLGLSSAALAPGVPGVQRVRRAGPRRAADLSPGRTVRPPRARPTRTRSAAARASCRRRRAERSPAPADRGR